MVQPVQQRACQAFCAKGFSPLFEWEVAVDEGSSALVALRDQREQQLCTRLAKRHEAQFIDDQQAHLGGLTPQSQHALLVSRPHQLIHWSGRSNEGDGHIFWQAASPRPSAAGLAGAGWTKCGDVLASLDPVAPCQLQDHHLVQLWDCLDVKAIKTFGGWKPGGLDPAFDHAAFTIDQFQFSQSGQIADVIQAFGGTDVCLSVVLTQEGWQAQGFEMVDQEQFWGDRNAHLRPAGSCRVWLMSWHHSFRAGKDRDPNPAGAACVQHGAAQGA